MVRPRTGVKHEPMISRSISLPMSIFLKINDMAEQQGGNVSSVTTYILRKYFQEKKIGGNINEEGNVSYP